MGVQKEEVAYLMRRGTHSMLAVFEVKGEATDASCSDKEIPAWAIFKAWNDKSVLHQWLLKPGFNHLNTIGYS